MALNAGNGAARISAVQVAGFSAEGGRRDDLNAYVTWDPPVSHSEEEKKRKEAVCGWMG